MANEKDMTPVETDNMTTPKSEKSDAYKFICDKKKEMKKKSTISKM